MPIDPTTKAKLRQAKADAILDALAQRLGYTDAAASGATRALANELNIGMDEVSRAKKSTAATTLDVWAYEQKLVVMQNPDGTVQVIDTQPSKKPKPATLGRIVPTTENP